MADIGPGSSAGATEPDATNPKDTDYGGIADLVLSHVSKYITTDAFVDVGAKILLKAFSGLFKALPDIAASIGAGAGKALVTIEEPLTPFVAGFVAPILGNMFGTDAPAEAFTSRDATGARADAARAIVEAFTAALAGDAGGDIEPSDEGAKRVATAAVHAAIEGWFNAFITETLGEVIPWDWLRLHDMTQLPEDVVRALGVSRLVRRAFSPLVDVTAATPMKWAINKAYRPTMLGASTLARELVRGKLDESTVREILARDGYGEDAIDALLNEQAKFLSASELYRLVRAGQRGQGDALQHLQDAGWSDELAAAQLLLEQLKDVESFERDMANAAITAYADGRIDSATLDTYTHGVTISDQEGAQLRELAAARRALRAQPLTSSEARAAVKVGVLAVSDYRDVLRREGRTEDAILVLELMLRQELDKEAKLEQLREQAAAERAAEKAAKDAAAAKKQAEIAAADALKRRGKVSDLQDAVVRGLIPITRLEEVLNAEYDADTVQILVDRTEQDRQAYLERQQRADDAAKRATQKSLSVGELRDALFSGVLTLDQVRARLQASGLAGADVDVLAATLADQLKAHQAAVQKRQQADTAAKARHIDLSRFEQLVRRGHRTIAEYQQLLASLDFDDASIGAMTELLQLEIADDQQAAQLRAAAAAKRDAKGVSLEDMRRGVILGVRTLDDFKAFLIQQGYTTDAQLLLTDELRDAVTSADAARQRRDATGGVVGGRALPIATLARAARLGLITVQAYQDRLAAAGYSPDDVALETDLLVAEIADAQAARTTADATPAPAGEKALTLGELAAAVRHGFKTLGDYQAAARAAGLDEDAVATQTRVLADELAATNDAQARRAAIGSELTAKGVSLAALEDDVRAGTTTIADYVDHLEQLGYAAADAELLGALLEDSLDGTPPAGGV